MKGKYPNRLRALIAERSLSPAALARAAETAPQNVHRLLNGERKLTKEWAEKLAPHIEGIAPADLLFSPKDEGSGSTSPSTAVDRRARGVPKLRESPQSTLSSGDEGGVPDIVKRHDSGRIHVDVETFCRELYAQLRMLRVPSLLATDMIDDFLEVLKALSADLDLDRTTAGVRIDRGSKGS